jgi:hypothetical protein
MSRRRKFDQFMALARPAASDRVIDVGVDDSSYRQSDWWPTNFFEARYPYPENITAVGLHEGEDFARQHPAVRYVQADGCSLPFDDLAFDSYFSNAVVEHVGDRDRQREFVAEAVRVARKVFMTTPNFWFPVEQHTWVPLVHWLPPRQRRAAFNRLGRPRANEIWLLKPRDFKALFPPGVDVRLEYSAASIIAFARRLDVSP